MDQRQWIDSLISKYARSLVRYTFAILKDQQAAKNVVESCLFRLAQQDAESAQTKLPSWLYYECRKAALSLWDSKSPGVPASFDGPGQIASYAPHEQELFRLKYADGLSYKVIGEIMGLSTSEVQEKLFSAMKTLRGEPAGDTSADAKAMEVLAFVHGELSDTDTQSMAERIEQDIEIKQTFESWLGTSDTVADLYEAISGPKETLSEGQMDKIRGKIEAAKVEPPRSSDKARRMKLIAGGISGLAAALAIFVFMDLRTTERSHEEEDEIQAASVPATDPAPIAIETQPATQEPTAAVEPPQATETPVEPVAAPAAPPVTRKAAAVSSKKTMVVDTSKTTVSKNLNKKNALSFLQKKLNKSESCLPTADKKTKAIRAAIGLKKDGTYTSVQVTAPSKGGPQVAKCLRAKLGSTAKSLQSNDKAGGKITLVIKVL